MGEGLEQPADGRRVFIPVRESDCSGTRPSWYPFQINVCDDDDPDPLPLQPRNLTIPDPEG